MKNESLRENKQETVHLLFMLVFYGYSSIIAQPSIPAGQVDIFVGADFNYRDLFHNGKIYEIC